MSGTTLSGASARESPMDEAPPVLPANAVLVRLFGGLGNQLLAYALARHAAWRFGGELWVDTSFFETQASGPRPFDLARLNVRIDRTVCHPGWPEPGKLRELHGAAAAIDMAGASAGDVMAAGPPLVLAGDLPGRNAHLLEPGFRALMLEETRLKKRSSAKGFAAWKRRIAAAQSPVLLHVRLGDYLALGHVFNMPDIAYYRAALASIDAVAPGAEIFVGTDDPEAVAQMEFGRPVTVLPPFPAPEALTLHRLCHHFVCGPSTFGWWSAYLGAHPGKRVIVPHRAYVDPGLQARYAAPDSLPPDWMRLAAGSAA